MISDKIMDLISEYGAIERGGGAVSSHALAKREQLKEAIEHELQLPRILARECYAALWSQAEKGHATGVPYSREALELIDLAKRLHLHMKTIEYAKGVGS